MSIILMSSKVFFELTEEPAFEAGWISSPYPTSCHLFRVKHFGLKVSSWKGLLCGNGLLIYTEKGKKTARESLCIFVNSETVNSEMFHDVKGLRKRSS